MATISVNLCPRIRPRARYCKFCHATKSCTWVDAQHQSRCSPTFEVSDSKLFQYRARSRAKPDDGSVVPIGSCLDFGLDRRYKLFSTRSDVTLDLHNVNRFAGKRVRGGRSYFDNGDTQNSSTVRQSTPILRTGCCSNLRKLTQMIFARLKSSAGRAWLPLAEYHA